MNNNYKVIKLSNGDDIICEMVNHDGDKYVIGEPLKMQVHDDETLGSGDSLSLTAWLAPFTENKTFEIKESHIIVITDASFGLTSYYKNIIKRRSELKLSDEVEEWDSADTLDEDEANELLERLQSMLKPKSLLH